MPSYLPGHAPEEFESLLTNALRLVREKGRITRADFAAELGITGQGALINKLVERVIKSKGYRRESSEILYEESKYF